MSYPAENETQNESPWHKRLQSFWRDYQWSILLGSEFVLLVLGYIGFARYTAAIGESLSPLDIFYLTLQLITMESGAISGPVGWELEVARLLIPAVTAYTALKAFAVIFRKQIQSLKLWFTRDHVVICGLGHKGFLLADDFCRRGETVVVIEQDESDERINLCRERGIIVLSGDATDVEVLRRAAVGKARWLISVCGDDGTNAEVAVGAQFLSANRRRGTLTCIIHLVDPQLCALLREREISDEKLAAFRLELFNIFDRGARILLREYPAFDETDQSPHLLVIGLGGMGESLVLCAIRAWREGRPSAERRLRVTAIDREAEWKIESLHVRYPRLAQVCELAPRQMEVRSSEFQRAEFLRDSEGRCDVNAAYICLDNDSLGLQAGLTLLQQVRGDEISIVIRMTREAGLATLLRGGRDSRDAFSNLYAFGLLDRTCTAEVVLGGTHETLARAAHEEYVRHQKQLGQTPQSNPVLVPWDELVESVKESNRRQTDHIGLKLKAVGCGIAPLTDWDAAEFGFVPGEVERMARMEHERWCDDLRREGWKHAAGPKNPEKKTHPALVPWEALPEADRETNRASVRELPAFLARAGLQVYRLK